MSLNIHVDTHGLERQFAAAPERITGELREVVTGVTLDAEGAVIAHTPVGATGHLRQSMTHTISGSGLSMTGRVFSQDVPIKVSSVEHGRRPGRMPPVESIQLWAARKLGDSSRGTAFVIARAIGRRGTRGAFMFRHGAATGAVSVGRRMAALRSAIARII